MKQYRIFRLTFGIHAVVSLVLGLGCYLLFRRDTYVNRWFGINGPLFTLSSGWVGDFLRFHLADAAWGYALTFSLAIIIPFPIAAFSATLWGTLWEFAQYAGFVKGTFDPIDILMYLSAALIATLFSYFFIKGDPP